MLSNVRYGIYYPEGRYLHVRTLGSGVQGTATLVRSVANGGHYVRKKTVPNGSPHQPSTCKEIELYRPHPRIPELISSHVYPALEAMHQRSYNMNSHSMIFKYCNGGTLTRFLDIRASDHRQSPSTLLVWKLFDDLLSTVHFFQQERTPAVTHNDAHTSNVFLHFPDQHARIPDFYLGDMGFGREIDSGIWAAGSRPGRRQLKSLDSVPGSYRTIFSEQVLCLATDMTSVLNNVGMLMTGLTTIDDTCPDDLMSQLQESGRWPDELFDCYQKLDDIICRMMYNPTPTGYDEFPALCRLVRNYRKQEQAKVTATNSIQDFRGIRPGNYDWSVLGGAEGEVANEHKMTPKLFDSRHQLIAMSRHIPGPWRIAHVDPHSFAVLGVEKLDFGYHVPYWPGYPLLPDRFKTNVDRFSFNDILGTAWQIDATERAFGCAVNLDHRHTELSRLFAVEATQ